MTEIDDLSPQSPRPERRRRPRVVPMAIAGLVFGVAIVLILNLLSASLFFYNADEAFERREELSDERFTLQGSPIGCSITEGFHGDDPIVAFSVTFGGRAVDIVHFGDPADLFQPDVPVVLDGAWVNTNPGVEGFVGIANDGWYFASDRMRVKHDNDYKNDSNYSERLEESSAASTASAEACAR